MVVGLFPSMVIGSEWACDIFAASEIGGKVCCRAAGLGFRLPRKEIRKVNTECIIDNIKKY